MHRISDRKKPFTAPAGLWFQLRSCNPILAWTAIFHAALFLIALGLFMVDSREVMGVNAWTKPMKFMVSITIYLATVAWLMGHIKRPRWAVGTITWGISSCMVVETILIFMQAGRGVRSHFNVMTPFDAGVFTIMGSGSGRRTGLSRHASQNPQDASKIVRSAPFVLPSPLRSAFGRFQ